MEKSIDPLFRVCSIKDFHLGRLIGRGAFGNVYLATLKSKFVKDRKMYAIKIVKKSLINTEKLVTRMKNEIKIHLSVVHDNIVKLHRVFQDSKCFYLVLDYCERGELFRYLKKRKKLSVEDCRNFFKQISKGVYYLHKKGIIHRDLKLSNILITRNNVIKIGDFGLSTRLTSSLERRMTQLGTPDYVAPEILKKRPHGFEVDLWSMGCILYALFIGHPPFHSHDIRKTLLKIRRNQFRILPRHNVPKEAEDLILLLLQPEESNRITIQEVCSHNFLLESREYHHHRQQKPSKKANNIVDDDRKSRYIRGRCGGIVRIVKNDFQQNNRNHEKYEKLRNYSKRNSGNTEVVKKDDDDERNIVNTNIALIRRTKKKKKKKKCRIEPPFEHTPICLDRLKTPYFHKTKNGCVEIRKDCVVFWYRTTKFQVFPSLQTIRIVSNVTNSNSKANNTHRDQKCDGLVVREYRPISTLPERYWKYYQYISEFVGVVRSRTVKLRILVTNSNNICHDDDEKGKGDGRIRLKCCVMENTPPDIECEFAGGLGRATFVSREGKVAFCGDDRDGRVGEGEERRKKKKKKSGSSGGREESISRMVMWWKEKSMKVMKQLKDQGRKDFPITVVLRSNFGGNDRRRDKISRSNEKEEDRNNNNNNFASKKRNENENCGGGGGGGYYSSSSIMSVNSAPGAIKSFDSKVMAKYLRKTDSTGVEMKRLYSI